MFIITDQNCTKRISIATLLKLFWNNRIQSLKYRPFNYVQIFYWSSYELVSKKLQKLSFIFLQFECFLWISLESDWLLWAWKTCDFEHKMVQAIHNGNSVQLSAIWIANHLISSAISDKSVSKFVVFWKIHWFLFRVVAYRFGRLSLPCCQSCRAFAPRTCSNL